VTTQPRRVSGRCTDSGPSTFLTDYLVICGRASARSMDSASATLESPLDSSKHIIAQLLCPVQRPWTQEFQLPASGLGWRHPQTTSKRAATADSISLNPELCA
jgi:hypothetical protein